MINNINTLCYQSHLLVLDVLIDKINMKGVTEMPTCECLTIEKTLNNVVACMPEDCGPDWGTCNPEYDACGPDYGGDCIPDCDPSDD